MVKALIIGAGAIGRGFLPWCLPDESSITFFDLNSDLIKSLDNLGYYHSFLSSQESLNKKLVKGYFYSDLKEIDSKLDTFDICFIAVGPRNVEKLPNLIRKITYSPMPGRTSVKAILNETAPNEGISATDNIICNITLAKVNMDFLINPSNREALLDYVIASLTYANKDSVRKWVETIYTNRRVDTVKIDADGVSNERTSKICDLLLAFIYLAWP